MAANQKTVEAILTDEQVTEHYGDKAIHSLNRDELINPDCNGEVLDTRFQRGMVANPLGRPKGSRNKLSERFLSDLHDLWSRRGMQIMDTVADKQPEKVLAAMVQVLPKDFQVSILDENQARWVISAAPALSSDEWADKHGPVEQDQED